jgi:hypothetical protein
MCVNVDSREVKEDGAVRHSNVTIREDMTKIFGKEGGSTVLAACKTQQKVGCSVVPDRDGPAFDFFAAEAMPRV